MWPKDARFLWGEFQRLQVMQPALFVVEYVGEPKKLGEQTTNKTTKREDTTGPVSWHHEFSAEEFYEWNPGWDSNFMGWSFGISPQGK